MGQPPAPDLSDDPLFQRERSELLDLCEAGVLAARRGGADEAEVYTLRSRSTEVTFLAGDLDQVKLSDETSFGVRVFVGERLGFATGNRPEQLQAVVAEAVAAARVSPADPRNRLPELAGSPAACSPVDLSLRSLDAGALAALVRRLVDRVRERDPRVVIDNTAVETRETLRAIASSQGVRAAAASGSAGGYLFGMAVSEEGVASFFDDHDSVQQLDRLEPALLLAADRFVDKCVRATGAGKGESFRGPLLLPAECFEELLLGALVSMLGADVVRQGRSPFRGRLGERIAAPGFTLTEGGAGLPGYPLAPFDREGTPRARRALVEDGVLRSFLTDGAEARALGLPSGGHATGGASDLPRVGASSLEVAAGPSPLPTLSKGLLVSRFSGSTNPVSGDFSGVVKGGLLISGGEQRPVKETTIAGNLWTALHAISHISSERELQGGTRLLPSVILEDIAVSAG